MARNKKATKSVIADRVKEVKKHVLRGDSRESIVQNFSSKWDITTRQVDNYIQRVNREIEAIASVEGEELYKMQMARLLSLYNAMLNAKQYGNALNTVKEINKLGNIYNPIKIDQSHEHTHELGDKLDKFLHDMVKNGEMSIEDIADDWHDDYARQLFPDWERAVNK